MNYRVLLALPFLFSTYITSGQTTKKPLKQWKVTGIALGVGIDVLDYKRFDMNTLYDFAPDMKRLGFRSEWYDEKETRVGVGAMFGGFVSMQRWDSDQKKFRNSEVHIGANITPIHHQSLTYSKHEISTSGGVIETAIFTKKHTQADFYVKYLFKTKDATRIRVFAGGGVYGAFAFNHVVESTLSKESYTNAGASVIYNPTSPIEKDAFDGRLSYLFQFRFPFGVSWRFANDMEIAIAARPGFGYQKVIGGSTHHLDRLGGVLATYRYLLTK